MKNIENVPVLAMYRARKDSKLLCDRLVMPLKDGIKILVRSKYNWEHEWIEATYCMKKWPIDDDDHDECAGYIYFDRLLGERWSPILVDDEVTRPIQQS
jgi:hypothetical protein